MGMIGMGVGNAQMGRRNVNAAGEVTSETPAKWTEDPKGGCVCLWPINPETMQPDGAAEIFGDWDAANYMARALELLQPNRKTNVPDMAAIVRQATKDGIDICDYCQECKCTECIVNEWKGAAEDE